MVCCSNFMFSKCRHQKKVLVLMTSKCLYLFFNFILGSEGKGIHLLILEIGRLRLRRKHYLRSHGCLVGWTVFQSGVGCFLLKYSSLLHTSCLSGWLQTREEQNWIKNHMETSSRIYRSGCHHHLSWEFLLELPKSSNFPPFLKTPPQSISFK